MITPELARSLADAGMVWSPASGDRFVIPTHEMDDEVFVVSEMTIEVDQLRDGGLVKFNGTTEWALDSIDQARVLWLPRESDLRERLGDHFVALEHATIQAGLASHVVVIEVDGVTTRHADADCECAYARALLALLGG